MSVKAIRRNPDISRLSRAAQRPGIDPREWVKFGLVQELGFDADHGMFADVQMLPNGEVETCHMGSNYSGQGFGEHNPLEVNDLVLVVYPEGTAEAVPVIASRIWAASQKPAAQFGSGDEPSQNRILVVKPGQKYQVYVSSGGTIELLNGSTSIVVGASEIDVFAGVVKIGDATAAPLAVGAALQAVMAALGTMATSFQNFAPGNVSQGEMAAVGLALQNALALILKIVTTKAMGT